MPVIVRSGVRLKTAPENSDGRLLTDEEYGRQRFELLKEKARLEELLLDTGHRVEQWVNLAEKTFTLACSARVWFAIGDVEVKKQILTAIGSNLTLKDKILCIEAKKPFVILTQSHSPEAGENSTFEPKKNNTIQGENGAPHGKSRSKLAQWDTNRTCLAGRQAYAHNNQNSYNINIPSYKEGLNLGWHIPVDKLLVHIINCGTECPQLTILLDNVFRVVSEYQKQAA